MTSNLAGWRIGVFAVVLAAAACPPNGPLVSSESPAPASSSASASSPAASPIPSGAVVHGPGSWQRGPAMSMPRADFTATMLADGRVLLTGGKTPHEVTATAEIY